MGALNTESNQTFTASSTGDYNGSSVHAPTRRSEKVNPFSLNTESNQTSFPADTSDGNGLSEHSLTVTSERVDSFGMFIRSNQAPSVVATSNFDGLRAHSPTAFSEKVEPFSLNTESSQISSAAAASNVNGLSIQSPTASSKKVDLFGLNTESNQTSSAAVTSNGNGLGIRFPAAASSEKDDPLGLNTESNQKSSSTTISNANGLRIHSTAARSEKGNPVGLNKESNQSSSTAAAPSNVNGPSAHSSTANLEKAIGTSSKFSSFSSSTSSPDSTLDDPFLEFDIEHEESTSPITVVPRQGKQSPQASENGKNTSSDHQIPLSTLDPALTYQHTPKSSPGYVFESPQTQVMERCNNSKYRIPSSVFARNKSTAPDWSMASNESLFSIQMGGASFTQDHYNYFRSGELGLQGEPSTSDRKLNSSPKTEAAGGNATDHDHWGKTQELSLGVENMKRDPSESGLEKFYAEGRISHYSVESNSSTKSFAFQVLTGDKDKITSARIGSSVKLCPETPKTPQQPQIDERQPSLKPAEPKTPAAASAAPQNRWFSCFPCCS